MHNMDLWSCLPTKGMTQLIEETNDSDVTLKPPDEGKDPEKPSADRKEWRNIEVGVTGIFNRQMLVDIAMSHLQKSITLLIRKDHNIMLFEWCHKKLFAKGMQINLERIKSRRGKELLDSIDDTWNFFYSQILPTLEAIFIAVKVPTPDLTIRKAALLSFRDVFLLKLDILSALIEVNFLVSPGIKQMFLILQSVWEEYPPSENKLKLELLVCRVIIPYLGYKGYYEGDAEPLFESLEPVLASQRRSVDFRRISRPQSIQPESAILKYLTAKHNRVIKTRMSQLETQSN